MASPTELIDRSIPFLDEIKNRTAEARSWRPGSTRRVDRAQRFTTTWRA